MKIPFLKINGKYSLIDLTNNEIKKREYDVLNFFYDGYAIVYSYDIWQYIDENENVLQLEYQYDEIRDFIDGLAAVRRNDRWWFINKNGVEVCRRGYNEYYRYRPEFIQVVTGFNYLSTSDEYNGDFEGYVGEAKDGLLDNKGFEIIPPIEECDISVANDFILLRNGNGYQAINFNGGKICTIKKYSYISSFNDNRALAIQYATEKLCIIDDNFNVVKTLGLTKNYRLSVCYFINGQAIDGYANGLCVLIFNDKYGVIDINGDVVHRYEYEMIYPFIDKCTVAAKTIDGKLKYTVLNLKCEEVIPLMYDKIDGFYEGYASVQSNGKWGVIDYDGNEIIKTNFDEVGYCTNGLISVSYGDYKGKDYHGIYGLYNTDGNKICPIVYDNIYIAGNLIITNLSEKYSLMDRKGNDVTKIKYDRIEKINYNELLEKYDSFVFVERDGKRFVVNNKGVEFIQDSADNLPF